MDQLATVFALFPRLKERRSQLAGTLSGGERQMLAIGRAMMAKPELLMLDEPSLGLAPRIVKEILQIVSELRTSGISVLLVEQNARAAPADRRLRLRAGTGQGQHAGRIGKAGRRSAGDPGLPGLWQEGRGRCGGRFLRLPEP
jgi:branched-chain amino acid transport system ATP-binding protein